VTATGIMPDEQTKGFEKQPKSSFCQMISIAR